ncbi:hypothetical protein J3A83DRAFT_2061946 [Scleroderma citrinum]
MATTIKHELKSLQSSSSDHTAAGVSHSHKDSSRHSSGISLPPLDYLQQQRRGSVTDPSLHAASAGASAFRQLDGPRPAPNYVFGDSSLSNNISEHSNKQMRKILRSPSPERDHGHHSNGKGATGHHTSSHTNGISRNLSFGDQTHSDDRGSPRMSMRHQDDSDFNHSRRQSITSSDSQHLHGTKRKMSSDREAMTSDEIDSQLTGPGIPSSISMELEGRAPKRRGSTVEAHRIAQLSIYDHRRHSIHAGAMVSGPGVTGGSMANSTQWWPHERRDSLPAILPNGSSGYTSAFSGDQPHGRPSAPTTSGSMATFAWPATQHPDGQQDPNIQSHARPFEPQTLPLPIMSPMTFPPDRRMSVPENPAPAVGPTRNIRSRSRPPSRQLREAAQVSATQAGTAAPAEEPSTAPPSTSTLKATKEPGSTPYSRSPELRISHKLAERKRRKEMKDLFDELRDQLPADRGMKASKWEILSKAIDFVSTLKQGHQEMARENELLRHELDSLRQGIPPFGPGGPPHPIVYSQGPVPGPYPPPPPGTMSHPPPHAHQPPPPHQQSQGRPSSSENAYQPGGGPPHQQPSTNGTASIATGRVEAPPT